jgi:acyl carrier protein
MGLDTVELVMELEDAFGIAIPNEMAAKIVTVADTVHCVAGFLSTQQPSSGVCASAHSFYNMRRELVDRCGLPRDQVTPDARLRTLIPPKHDRRWPAIAAASGLLRADRFLFRKCTPRASIREIIETRYRTNWRNFDGTIDEEKVFQLIRQIVSDQTAIPIEEIQRESRYIEDMGMS